MDHIPDARTAIHARKKAFFENQQKRFSEVLQILRNSGR
jgi:hypothetical protein